MQEFVACYTLANMYEGLHGLDRVCLHDMTCTPDYV